MLNLSVEYKVDDDKTEYGKVGENKFYINGNFMPTETYNDNPESNFYLRIVENSTERWESCLKYIFACGFDNIGKGESFCNEGNCERRGYIRNYTQINGYFLKKISSARENGALIFDYEIRGIHKFFTTMIDGKKFVLTYHPQKRKLLLHDDFFLTSTRSDPSNIIFVSDSLLVWTALNLTQLKPYRDISLTESAKRLLSAAANDYERRHR